MVELSCPRDGTTMVEQTKEKWQRDVLLDLECPKCGGHWMEKRSYA